MPEIHLLTREISDLIAAGEVIERPSSVVKELVENSIDAGAKKISIEIIGGGLKKIKVSDDGIGMSKENAEKCFLKHATSKILNKEDLFSIKTLGFRGEALPSVAAVSKVKLITKEKDSLLGYEILNEAGVVKNKGEIGSSDGTTFEVSDLFYNTPARLKFMKSEQAETGVINSLIEKLALSHPDISFKFSSNGNMKVFTPGSGKVSDAIYAVYGRDFASRLLQVNYSADNIKIKGYTGKPLLNKPNRNFQIFFVNGRLIKSRVLQQALEQSYRNAMLVGRYPCCVIFITVPFAEVDINVHPSKTEIKFADDTYISNHLNRAISVSLREDVGIFQVEDKQKKNDVVNEESISIKSHLNSIDSTRNEVKDTKTVSDTAPNDFVENSSIPVDEVVESDKTIQEEIVNFGNWQIIKPQKEPQNKLKITTDDTKTVNSVMNFSSESVELRDSNKVVLSKEDIDNSLPVTKENVSDIISDVNKELQSLKSTEILLTETIDIEKPVEKDSDSNTQIQIIPERETDFRVIGELFKTYILIEKDKELQLIDKHALHERMIFEQLKVESGISSQILLTPYVCNLGASENNIIYSNKNDLRSVGFDIDSLGTALIIREIPEIVNIEDIEYILSKVIDLIRSSGRITEEVFDELLYIVACKAAIKSGYNTTSAEIEALIKDYFANKDNLRYCPHGRPIVISFTQSFIEKQFKRIM